MILKRLPVAWLKNRWLKVSLLVLNVAFLLVIFFYPVDILSCPKGERCNGDFSVKTDKTSYVQGEDMIVTSQWVKSSYKRGEPTRYLDCKNKKGQYGSLIELSKGKGSNPPGPGRAVRTVPIPFSIPDLPTTCRPFISIEYSISWLRDLVKGKHIEYAYGNEVRIEKNDKVAEETPDLIIYEVSNGTSSPAIVPFKRSEETGQANIFVPQQPTNRPAEPTAPDVEDSTPQSNCTLQIDLLPILDACL